MGQQRFLVDAGHVVVPLEEGQRRKLDEVLESGLIFGQYSQVESRIAPFPCLPLGPRGWCNICFVANQRIDRLGTAFLVELQCAVQVAVIGERHGIHTAVLDRLHQFGNTVGAIQQAVMAVAMEVRERTITSRHCGILRLKTRAYCPKGYFTRQVGPVAFQGTAKTETPCQQSLALKNAGFLFGCATGWGPPARRDPPTPRCTWPMPFGQPTAAAWIENPAWTR